MHSDPKPSRKHPCFLTLYLNAKTEESEERGCFHGNGDIISWIFLFWEKTRALSAWQEIQGLASGYGVGDHTDNINQCGFFARAGQGCKDHCSQVEHASVLLKQPVTSRHPSLAWGGSSLPHVTVAGRVCCSFSSLSSLPPAPNIQWVSHTANEWLLSRCLIMLTFHWPERWVEDSQGILWRWSGERVHPTVNFHRRGLVELGTEGSRMGPGHRPQASQYERKDRVTKSKVCMRIQHSPPPYRYIWH